MCSNPTAQRLATDIHDLENAERSLAEKRLELDALRRKCTHSWSKPERKTEYHKPYTIPGDPVGTMGVDRRPDCHVEAKTDVWWKRTCSQCGKVEKTTNTRSVGSEPVF